MDAPPSDPAATAFERHGATLLIHDLDIALPARVHLIGIGAGTSEGIARLTPLVADRLATALTIDASGEETADHWVGDAGIPGPASLRAGRRLRETLEGFDAGDSTLVILSDGADTLIEEPLDGLTMEDLRDVAGMMRDTDAEPAHTEAVLAPLSRLKAGGLARAAAPARTVVLVVSQDRNGDPATLYGGPFNQGRQRNALDIARRYGLLDRVSPAVANRWRDAASARSERVRAVPHRYLAG